MKFFTQPNKVSQSGTSCALAMGAMFLVGICPLADAKMTELRVEGLSGWTVSDDPQPMLAEQRQTRR